MKKDGITPKKPKLCFSVDYLTLFSAVGDAIVGASTQNGWDLGKAVVNAVTSLRLKSRTPAELAFSLISEGLVGAMLDLCHEAQRSVNTQKIKEMKDKTWWEKALTGDEILLDETFFDKPQNLPALPRVGKVFTEWLQFAGIPEREARMIANRLPLYFVLALRKTLRKDPQKYEPLLIALQTRLDSAAAWELAWYEHHAFLMRQPDEPMFGEAFGLRNVYVALRGYFEKEQKKSKRDEEARTTVPQREKYVVWLEEALQSWVEEGAPACSIRVISGGPGSGKSSFAKMLGAKWAKEGAFKVLFVPLHRLSAEGNFSEKIKKYTEFEGFPGNPLDASKVPNKLVVILDGLDELSSQGKSGEETAKVFMEQVKEWVRDCNHNHPGRVRVLVCGRELAVQQQERVYFSEPGQILHVLGYWTDTKREHYIDPKKVLAKDLRDEWWKQIGKLRGRTDWKALPKALKRGDLTDITTQPLLNYFLTLIAPHVGDDFPEDITKNFLYRRLIEEVFEREKKKDITDRRHLTQEEFLMVLEEIGIAAWHDGGRCTPIKSIEQRCKSLENLWVRFQGNAESGIVSVLAAFYFRRDGMLSGKDATFEFTHKSFGEYLSARRIVSEIEDIVEELDRKKKNHRSGIDEGGALRKWAELCAQTPISIYQAEFILGELREKGKDQVARFQQCLAKLLSLAIVNGLDLDWLPGEKKNTLQILKQSVTAEVNLLVCLSKCAIVTNETSNLSDDARQRFGPWIFRAKGVRNIWYKIDFKRLNLQNANLAEVDLTWMDLMETNLEEADLTGANLWGADLEGANLECAGLEGANLEGANLEGANLWGACLMGANLKRASLWEADLRQANLQSADLLGVELEGTNLDGATMPDGQTWFPEWKLLPGWKPTW